MQFDFLGDTFASHMEVTIACSRNAITAVCIQRDRAAH
jgi:hypothetical protein